MPDSQESLDAKLFNTTFKSTAEMTKQEADLLVEQYKLYVEMMDKVSERRHQANSFFLSVNTVLITVLTGFAAFMGQSFQSIWIVVASLAGILFCFTWRRLIISYSQLNRGKFVIIHLLEQRLPAKMFAVEWDALNKGDGTVYNPFTQTERGVPLVFASLYSILLVLTAVSIMISYLT